jgi:flagellar biosynthesis protein FliQ
VFLSFVLFLPWMTDTLLGFVVPLLQDVDRLAR